jgi:hypothetical protein
MSKGLRLGAGAAGVLVLVVLLAATGAAAPKHKRKPRFLTVSAPTFVPVQESTHNHNGNSVCANGFVPHSNTAPEVLGSENQGDLNAIKGSYLAPVSLPGGATIRRLNLYANDNDNDDGVYMFLVRKQLADGLSPQFNGYQVLAQTNSTGAGANTMRRFTDTTVDSPKVNNKGFSYYLEMVNCAVVEPFAAQIVYRP